MESQPVPVHHVPARDNEPAQWTGTMPAALQAQVDLGPMELGAEMCPPLSHPDGDGNMSYTLPVTVADDHDSSPSPSAATTRVNSGVTEHELTMNIANKLETITIEEIDTDSSSGNNASPPVPNPNHHTGPDPLSNKMKPIRSLLILFILSAIYTALFIAFVVVVLLRKHVETPGGVFWAAPKTNYLVSVMSQVFAMLTDTLIRDCFAALRPALGARGRQVNNSSRGSRPGSSFATWVGLSPAASWSSVFKMAAIGAFLNPWCNSRLVLPIMGLAFGSILKFDADFEYYFRPGPVSASMQVYAGLTPPNIGLLYAINASDLAMYEETWSSSLLGVSQFARDFRLPGCNKSCRSVMLPGGLQNIRLVSKWLNESLYSVTTFANSETITIYGATGMVVQYEEPEPGTLEFDLDEHCTYAGEAIDNGVQLCVKQDMDSIIVGWSACPIDIYDRKMCNDANSTWRSQPIESGTRMSLFSQVATTSYDRKNQSIVNIQTADSDKPKRIPLSAEDYSKIFARALQSTNRSSAIDTNNINTLGSTVSWMHRTFLKTFREDKTSAVTNLHNFLAVPVQFSITANIYANYTAPNRGLGRSSLFSLPDDMIVTARGGKSASRLAILPWAGWLFISVAVALHVGVFGGIGFILSRETVIKGGEMGVQDLDDVRLARDTAMVRVVGDSERGTGGGKGGGFVPRMRSWVVGGFVAVVPPRWREKWVAGRDRDLEKLFGQREGHGGGNGGHVYDEGVSKSVEEGRSVLGVALGWGAGDNGSAWRLARAAQRDKVRIVM